MSWYTFTRDSGEEIEVSYRYRHGSPDTYSPLHGAEGGDPAEIEYEQATTGETGTDPFDLAALTEAESDRLDTEIHEKHAHDDLGDSWID